MLGNDFIFLPFFIGKNASGEIEKIEPLKHCVWAPFWDTLISSGGSPGFLVGAATETTSQQEAGLHKPLVLTMAGAIFMKCFQVPTLHVHQRRGEGLVASKHRHPVPSPSAACLGPTMAPGLLLRWSRPGKWAACAGACFPVPLPQILPRASCHRGH